MIYRLMVFMAIPFSVVSMSFGQTALAVADKELNKNYQALMKKLPASMKESLQATQRLWIRYTDENCEFKDTIEARQFAACKLSETLRRSGELSYLLSSMEEEVDRLKGVSEFTALLKNVLTNLESIPTVPEEGIYWPGGSAHTVVTQLLKRIGMRDVVSQYGKPIFLDGPHTQTVLNLESSVQFGHYDPAFLIWLEQNLDILVADMDFVDSTRPMVNRYLLATVELYLSSYYYLLHNSEVRDEILLEYMLQYQGRSLDDHHHAAFFVPSLRKENTHWDGKTKSEQYLWYYPEATTQWDWILTNLNEQWEYVPVGSSIFFWIRRSIDGTDQLFLELMTKFYQAYDLEGWQKIENQIFTAPKTLPAGTIIF